MKRLTASVALILVFGFLAHSAFANSPRLIAETYVIRVFVEEYDLNDGMFLDAFWVEDQETKDERDVAAMKNLLALLMPTPVVEMKLQSQGIYRVISDGQIAIKRYFDDGSVVYVTY